MKQIICEMCDGTEFKKENGEFVCCGCGTHYSVEEAKKLMVEIGNDVVGNSSNGNQVENLLNLARSSFESNNFEKTEDFCNQILAVDSMNYDAWRLKGEAINGQINANNPRIDEVFNCVMQSYRVSSPEEKEDRGSDLITWLLMCFQSEIDFWLGQLEAQRPSEAVLQKAKNSFVDCWNKMQEACDEMEFPEELKTVFLNQLDNHFIVKAEVVLVSTWNSTVAYNYYRNTYSNGRWTDEDYRPSDEIFSTFIEEGDILIKLMYFCEEQFNDNTEPADKKALYGNIAFIHEELSKGQSYNRMVSTTTNGYGAVTNRYEYWENSRCLTDEAVKSRRNTINKCRELEKKYEKEAEAKAKAEKEEEERLAREEAQKKIDAYWEEHKEEKEKLENEKVELEKTVEEIKKEYKIRVDALNKQLSEVSSDEINALSQKIRNLESEKSSLGLFKGKEKKAIQENIDKLAAEKALKQQEYDAAKKAIEDEISNVKNEEKNKLSTPQNRIKEITTELTKARD